MLEKITVKGVKGYFVPLNHPAIKYLEDTIVGSKYPELFDQFWKAYPSERRDSKQKCFFEWRKLSPEDRESLPHTVGAYHDYILIESELKYMKLTINYLKNETFRNYQHKQRQSKTLACLAYWDVTLRGVAGIAPAWKSDDRALAVEDIRRISPDKWNDYVWIFFSGRDPVIEDQKKKLGLHYKTFHSMLTKELLNTRVKKPVPCQYCGELGGRHDPGCPIITRRKLKEQKVKQEYESAKDLEFDLMESFKKKVGK
ncbi:MAG: hypothetical protein DRH37_00755 [Deltaproteobacteria bacterium]|nr:MAG: hypothetical protein DRH37_00755 [Deltaproteobacteria bacterium]